MTKDSSGEPIASLGEGGDRAAVEQARKRNNENAESKAEEGKHCEWLWDSASTARSVATSVVDAGREVRLHMLYGG